MVRKSGKSGTAAPPSPKAGRPDDSELAARVRHSAQQIWLAGMGAFSKAQAERGKVFEALVEEGMRLQRRTQGLAEEKVHEVGQRMSSLAGEVTARAGQGWDRLESIFESRTARALGRLGVPTAADLQALSARVDALAAAVAGMLSTAPAPRPTAAKRSTRSGSRGTSGAAAKAASR